MGEFVRECGGRINDLYGIRFVCLSWLKNCIYYAFPKTRDASVWRGPDIAFGMTVCGCFV